jgi:Na+/H+ antiporter NhaC
MADKSTITVNNILIRGACLWLLMAILLAWSMVGIFNDVGFLKSLFSGSFSRLLQAHIDFLLMTALIFGFYATKVELPWHVRWAMVIGAFTNSSLFLLFAIFPNLDPASDKFTPTGAAHTLFNIYMYSSLVITSYGFGKGAVIVLKSSFQAKGKPTLKPQT